MVVVVAVVVVVVVVGRSTPAQLCPSSGTRICGGGSIYAMERLRNVMITFLVQLATLTLLSTLASWEPLGPNKRRTGLTTACAPGLPTRQSLCPTSYFCLRATVCGHAAPAPLQAHVYQQPGVGATFRATGASKTWIPPAFLLGARRQADPLCEQCRTSL